MQSKIVTQYSCDFCKKKLIAKHAMVKHEKFCMNNPENKMACYEGCTFLETRGLLVDGYSDNYFSAPYCTKLEKFLTSIRALEKKLPERYPETFEEHIPMPKECEHFNNGATEDIKDFF